MGEGGCRETLERATSHLPSTPGLGVAWTSTLGWSWRELRGSRSHWEVRSPRPWPGLWRGWVSASELRGKTPGICVAGGVFHETQDSGEAPDFGQEGRSVECAEDGVIWTSGFWSPEESSGWRWGLGRLQEQVGVQAVWKQLRRCWY